MEIKVSDIAKEKIIFAARENNVDLCVRLYVMSAACSGARFGIVFDEPKQNDVMIEIDGIEFITDTEFVPKFADGLNIEYLEGVKEGYMISSLRSIKGNCGSDCDGCKH